MHKDRANLRLSHKTLLLQTGYIGCEGAGHAAFAAPPGTWKTPYSELLFLLHDLQTPIE
jgi:hypothetical protein